MLPKLNRLPASEFSRVLGRGKRLRASMFQLAYTESQLPFSRFGFIVSVKVDKRAVVRNRIKRLLRESVRRLLPQLLPGYDVALTAKQPPSPLNYQEVSQVVKELLARAKLLR